MEKAGGSECSSVYLVKIAMDICVVDDRSNNNKRQHQAIAERRGELENPGDNNLIMYETQRVVCSGFARRHAKR